MYLSTNDSGELVLAASASRPGTTLFMTLQPDADGVQLTGWLTKRGTLLAPPDTRGRGDAEGLPVGVHPGRRESANACADVDRLVHHSVVLEFSGKSVRAETAIQRHTEAATVNADPGKDQTPPKRKR